MEERDWKVFFFWVDYKRRSKQCRKDKKKKLKGTPSEEKGEFSYLVSAVTNLNRLYRV